MATIRDQLIIEVAHTFFGYGNEHNSDDKGPTDKINFPIAPDRRTLREFGGILDIDEFRRLARCKTATEIKALLPFEVVPITFVERVIESRFINHEDGVDDHEVDTTDPTYSPEKSALSPPHHQSWVEPSPLVAATTSSTISSTGSSTPNPAYTLEPITTRAERDVEAFISSIRTSHELLYPREDDRPDVTGSVNYTLLPSKRRRFGDNADVPVLHVNLLNTNV
jgi:hypothetical protein